MAKGYLSKAIYCSIVCRATHWTGDNFNVHQRGTMIQLYNGTLCRHQPNKEALYTLTKNNLQNTFYKTKQNKKRYEKMQMLKFAFNGKDCICDFVKPQAMSGNIHKT